jgi:transposase-like protein
MAPKTNDTPPVVFSQTEFHSALRLSLLQAVRTTLAEVLQEEVTQVIQAQPYERSPLRRDRRNGAYTRTLDTSVGRLEDLAVPRTRPGFQTQVFERYQRRQREVDETIGAMFIQGVSTAQVGQVLKHLNGLEPKANVVSRAFHKLEDEFTTWKKRPLAAHDRYCFADGTYFRVIYNQEGCKTPILAVIGIRWDGTREVLGFSVGDRENEGAWQQLLDDLKTRGVHPVDLWITDGNQAMLNAVRTKFPQAQRQRCIKHKLANVLRYIPKKQHALVAPELKAIFYQAHRRQAEQALAAFCAKYESVYPTAVAWLQRDQDACLTFYDFPREHWKTICTTNVIERLVEEVKKRIHQMSAAFRNEDSCTLMFYAVIRDLNFKKVTMPK